MSLLFPFLIPREPCPITQPTISREKPTAQRTRRERKRLTTQSSQTYRIVFQTPNHRERLSPSPQRSRPESSLWRRSPSFESENRSRRNRPTQPRCRRWRQDNTRMPSRTPRLELLPLVPIRVVLGKDNGPVEL